MFGSNKQKYWLSDQTFAKKYGFAVVDSTDNGYELLALSFDGTTPEFTENVKIHKIKNQVIKNEKTSSDNSRHGRCQWHIRE
ncbi:MAG: hypothetical protein M0P01_06775 [Treponema sp.]|nr:hypothetical protein [Treponema sp.]